MKARHIMGILLAGALCMGCVVAIAAGGGTSSDPLVKKSYLDGSYLPSVNAQIESRADEQLKSVEQEAESKLQEANERLNAQKNGNSAAMLQLHQGDRITSKTGNGILVISGTFRVTHNGVVVDVTVGAEVASGSTTAANHRYLAAEGTTAVFTVESDTATVFLQGSGEQSSSALPFLDVKESDWYYEAVCFVYQNALFNGTSASDFSPLDPMNRGMLAVVLYRLAGKPDVKHAAAFKDVTANAYYADAVAWASEQKIVTGTTASQFSPNAPITREQLAVMLYRYARQYAGLKTDTSASLEGFSDGQAVSSYAKEAMRWAVGAKIIQGAGGKLNPAGKASRAEVAAMLQRFSALCG